MLLLSLLLGNVLPTERYHTDDLLSDLLVPCLPPCRVDSKVLGLNGIVDCSQPGGSWTPHGDAGAQCMHSVGETVHSATTVLQCLDLQSDGGHNAAETTW